MRTTFFLLPAWVAIAAAVAAPQQATPSSATPPSTATGSQATSTSSPAQGTIGLGETCDPGATNPCVLGSQCYATNSMLIPSCGNFQAACTSNSQCAFNTCNNGFCNGPATPGIVALGEPCSYKLPGQCANGANCYATNYMLIPRCGNFQSSCINDSQCAFNTCNSGLCNGFLSSTSSYGSSSSAPTGSISSSSYISASTSLTAAVTPVPSTAVSSSVIQTVYGNSTITGPFLSVSTSVVVIGGTTTSVLVNSAGSTSALPTTAKPTSTSSGTQLSAGAKGSVQSVVAFFSVVVSAVFVLVF